MSIDATGGQQRNSGFPGDTDQSHAARSEVSFDDVHIDTGAEEGGVEFDEQKLIDLFDRLEGEQSFALGLLAGLGAAFVGALIWAAITYVTNFQIGFMAVGVGFLVGYAVRIFGRGMSSKFGYAGAGCALLGCVAGNLLTASFYLAFGEGVPLLQAVVIPFIPAAAVEIMAASFHPMDLLFYGIALYEGYRFSFRQIEEHELMSAVKTGDRH